MRTKVTQDRRWKSGCWSLFADMSPGGCSCEVSKRHASPIFFEALSDACIRVAQASAVNRPPDSKAMGVTFKQYQKICILLYTNPQKFGGILCSIFFLCVWLYTIYINRFAISMVGTFLRARTMSLSRKLSDSGLAYCRAPRAVTWQWGSNKQQKFPGGTSKSSIFGWDFPL